MKITSPRDLLFDQLRDLHSAASQTVISLPTLIEQASDDGLRRILNGRERQVLAKKDRLQEIFDRHGEEGSGDMCMAMKGLIEGGHEHLAAVDDPQTRDLMLVAHCSRMGCYEVAGYRIAGLLAEHLEFGEEATKLSEIVAGEQRFTETLEARAAAILG